MKSLPALFQPRVHFSRPSSSISKFKSYFFPLPLLSSYVGKFISRKDRLRDFGHDQHFTNVYVKNFGEDFTDENLMEVFGKYGKIMSAKVMIDHSTGRSVLALEWQYVSMAVCEYGSM